MRTYHWHGLTKTPEFRVWGRIKHYASKRGIEFDARWSTFQGFLRSMGKMPKGYYFIRRDLTEGYTEDNCFWGTKDEKSGRTAYAIYMREYRKKRVNADTNRRYTWTASPDPTIAPQCQEQTGRLLPDPVPSFSPADFGFRSYPIHHPVHPVGSEVPEQDPNPRCRKSRRKVSSKDKVEELD